jgi:hypothetical protein
MSSCATTPRSSDPRRRQERDVRRGGADRAEALRREKIIHTYTFLLPTAIGYARNRVGDAINVVVMMRLS